MNKTKLIIAAALSFSITGNTIAQDTNVTKKQVDKFIKVNRSNLLVTYACSDNQNPVDCNVICSSAGTILIESNNVQRAYYAERLNRIDHA